MGAGPPSLARQRRRRRQGGPAPTKKSAKPPKVDVYVVFNPSRHLSKKSTKNIDGGGDDDEDEDEDAEERREAARGPPVQLARELRNGRHRRAAAAGRPVRGHARRSHTPPKGWDHGTYGTRRPAAGSVALLVIAEEAGSTVPLYSCDPVYTALCTL